MAAVRDYKKLAADIKSTIGEQNIVSATHCATRLRLVLKQSPSDDVTKAISAMPGVIQVMEKGGQYQIVIGTHAKDVYAELAGMMDLSAETAPAEKQSFLNRVIAAMSGIFAPFVYILAAGGLIQGVLIIINQFAPAFAKTGTYSVLNLISWTPFVFLPVLIAITASHHFKCNTFVAVWCALALTGSMWTDIATQIGNGDIVRFLGIRLTSTTYTSTVLPPIFMVLVLSYLEKFLNKHLPDVIKAIAVPFISAAVMIPATILVIGPVTQGLSNLVAEGYTALYNVVPPLASAIIGGVWEVLVIFGIHWGMAAVSLANQAAYGFDTIQIGITIAVVSQMAAAFAVFARSRNKQMKETSLSAGITAIFGITEPTVYGVTLRLKKPFVCACISAAIGNAAASLFGTRYFQYAGLPGVLTCVNAIDQSKNGAYPASFAGILIGMAIAVVLTFVSVLFIGFEDKADPETELQAAAGHSEGQSMEVESKRNDTPAEVLSPLTGTVVKLADVPDPTFAGEVLGKGVAVIPSEGKLYATFDGTVENVFDTKHAIALTSDTGVELLIHIGLETVELKGKYFEPKVKDGDRILKGDLLMEFDLKEISKSYKMFTPVLVTNADEFYDNVVPEQTEGEIRAGDRLLTVGAAQV